MGFFKLFKKEIKTEIIEINGLKFTVTIHFENRRNSRASINKKAINIRIPYFLNQAQKEQEAANLKSWVIKKLKENPDKFKPDPSKEYKNNDLLKIGDKNYTLKINFKNKKGCSAKLINDEIHLFLSSGLSMENRNRNISILLSRLAGHERLPKLKEKMKNLNDKYFNQPINKISFKHQKSRWGSCSSKGNINISTRLLFAPDDVLEYVCIHELAHLKYLNHSKKFWDLVKNAMPDYKDKKKWLKINSHRCDF